jgi:prophage antirepressor-like protein
MQREKEKQVLDLQVTDGLTVAVIPESNHEFLLSSADVASGFGVSKSSIREHQRKNSKELHENKHFVKAVSFSDTLPKGIQPHAIFWTKRGIVRLGFFIKSKRARLFRDWAEDLIINKVEQHSRFSRDAKRLKERYVELPEYKPLIDMVNQATVICGSQEQLAKRLGTTSPVLSLLHRRPWLVSDEKHRAIELGCRNVLGRGGKLDTEALEQLLAVDDREIRISLYKKMQKGGLL